MAEAGTAKAERTWTAALGWGGLLVFMGLFAWLIIGQLRSAETWSGRKQEAIELVKQFRPLGPTGYTMYDLLRAYALRAKQQDAYVGEFTWDARHRDGPEYEVTLLWKEGEDHHVAVWRVNLKRKEIRPQGDEAASLPRRAQGGVRGS